MHRREFAQLALLFWISPAAGALAGCAPELAPDGAAPARPSSPGTTPAAAVGTLETGASLNGPTGVAFAPDGLLHVADSGNARVQVFTTDGRWVASYGGYGSAEGQMDVATAVRFDAAGRAWVADLPQGLVHVFEAS